MIRLRDTSLVPPAPPGGYRYADGREAVRGNQFGCYVPETDTWIFFGSFSGLAEKLREHLIVNQLPVPADIDTTLAVMICQHTDPTWKGCREAAAPKVNFVTWGQAKRWLKTMLNYARDRALVEQEEAERRAAICLQCRLRVPQAECKTGGCGGSVAGFLTQLAINRSTPHDDALGACGVCGCILKAMAHFPNETLDKASAGLSYPEDTRSAPDDGPAIPCWRRTANAGSDQP